MAVQLYSPAVNTVNTLPERFERKYYLVPRDVGLAYGLLRQVCLPAREYPYEQINSLYFDTADLEQHEHSESGDYYKDKVRIRWYGECEDLQGMQTVFLELKSRRGFAGIKQRLKLQVPAESLTPLNLGKGIIPRTLLLDTMARFGYFPSQMLLPIIKISYWRYRFSEIMTEQRVSLDYHIWSTVITPGLCNGEKELELPGAVIEIKGRTMELPTALRCARMLYTDWSRFSKYSACINSHYENPGTVGRLSPSGRIVQIQNL
ncbi:MAG: VTC domain-containing protein [Dehalococcoidia bacterium]|nr:VTC domain-containing protein [Dehalococcoidia bacterium]